MLAGVVAETHVGERRVALAPASLDALKKLGIDVLVQQGAGVEAGFTDKQYTDKGATLADRRSEVFAKADLVIQVRALAANPTCGATDLELLRPQQTLLGFCEPMVGAEQIRSAAATGATVLSVELLPRITRAQAMDALSSQANIAGYQAVLEAAVALPKMFPMMMTAAGTVHPSKVLVIGAGVAGLQAIATARRLGAIVSAYDVRPVVKEQVESLGAKFVELPMDTADAQEKTGYAKEQSAEQQQRQQELMARVVAESDVVITTALIPGRPAPKLVSAEMVRQMAPGSVIVDLAAERGGNCALTVPDQTIVTDTGAKVIGASNLAAAVPFHASQAYSNNMVALLRSLVKDGAWKLHRDDEIVAGVLVCQGGDVVHPLVRKQLGLPEAAPATASPPRAT